MGHERYKNLYPALDMKVKNQKEAHASVDTCPERDVILRLHFSEVPFNDTIPSIEMTPEEALKYAECIKRVANEIITRRIHES